MNSNSLATALTGKANLFFRALSGESTEARCRRCGSVERVILLDVAEGEGLLADYRCRDCDLQENSLSGASG